MIENTYPVALSRLGDENDTREKQAERAITWLRKQSGGSITVITPNKRFENKAIERLIQNANVKHYTWRKTSGWNLTGRVLYAWPNREKLNELEYYKLDALAVIEWNEIPDWIERTPSITTLF